MEDPTCRDGGGQVKTKVFHAPSGYMPLGSIHSTREAWTNPQTTPTPGHAGYVPQYVYLKCPANIIWFQRTPGILKIIVLKKGFRTLESESLSHVRLFVTPWTLQFIEFSRPEYWSGWPISSPTDLPNPGIKLGSPALQADSLPTGLSGKPFRILTKKLFSNRHSSLRVRLIRFLQQMLPETYTCSKYFPPTK